MKLALLILYGFLRVQSRHFAYLHPRYLNPTMVGPFKSFGPALPRFVFTSHPHLTDTWLPHYKALDRHQEWTEARKLDKPIENNINPRLLFSTGLGYSAVAGIFRTYIFTSIITTTIPSVSRCIPSSQFSPGAANVTCLRRKRQIAEYLDALEFSDDGESIRSSPAQRVEITATQKADEFQGERTRYGSSEVTSSKEASQEIESTRSERFFNGFFALTTTTTIYSFVTSALSRQVNVVSAAGNSAQCNGVSSFGCLICVPVGYGVC